MSFFYCTYFSIYETNNRIFLFNELRKSTYYYSIFMDLENLSIFFFLFRFVQIYHRFSWERTIWFLVRVRKVCMCDNCEIASVRGNIHLKRMIHRWLLLLHEIREKYIAMIRLEMKGKNVISKGISNTNIVFARSDNAPLAILLRYLQITNSSTQFPNICFLNSRFYDPRIMRFFSNKTLNMNGTRSSF